MVLYIYVKGLILINHNFLFFSGGPCKHWIQTSIKKANRVHFDFTSSSSSRFISRVSYPALKLLVVLSIHSLSCISHKSVTNELLWQRAAKLSMVFWADLPSASCQVPLTIIPQQHTQWETANHAGATQHTTAFFPKTSLFACPSTEPQSYIFTSYIRRGWHMPRGSQRCVKWSI